MKESKLQQPNLITEGFHRINQFDASKIPYPPTKKPAKNWLKQKSLSIRQQISLGYTVTMAIAILGTTTGLLIGHQYQKQVYERIWLTNAREKLLSHLEMTPWTLPFESNTLQTKEEFEQQKNNWLIQIDEVQENLLEIEDDRVNFPQDDSLLTQVQKNLPAYTAEIEILSEQIQALQFKPLKPQEVSAVRQLLLNFYENPTVREFNRLSEELHELTRGNEEEIGRTLAKANRISQQIIFGSLLLSVLFAIGFAIYTSRAIARPLEEMDIVAERVNKESNFDLKFPVSKQDELGKLAVTLNQMIYSFKDFVYRGEEQQETQLMQVEKMASLGKMLAGVAHEVNNPINFIYGNLVPAREYIEDILSLIEAYQTEISNPPEAITELTESIELDFVREDLRKILKSMKLGAERVREIAQSLKSFSRLDDELPHPVNLHNCIDSTLIMLDNRIKKGITVVKNYGDIPEIEGYMGLLYQVFMNLLSNAMDALETQVQSQNKPRITITTGICDFDPEYAIAKIADNGTGIDSEAQKKIFETFFTTKGRGIGTGLGLAITRKIVEEKHQGKLIFHSEVGEGTEFSMILPIKYQISEHL